MPAPLKIGITGGIGSGKSTVAKIFACLGIPVYDADSRAKTLMNTDPELISLIKDEFGTQSFDESGRLNRRYLAEHVFGFPDRLEKLNRLVHPRVAQDYARWVEKHKSSVFTLKEAALLFEAGSAKDLDKVIAVTAPDSIRIERVMKRDGRSEEEVKKIIKRQLPQDRIASMADFVIINDETQMVTPQVLDMHREFKESIAI